MAAITTASSPPEVGSKERFFRYFQHEATALQEQMERLNTTSFSGGERNDAVDHCLAGIERLSHEVKDASTYIPTYDQRTYGEASSSALLGSHCANYRQAIKALSEKLQSIRNTFAPPKKFQFKTARKNPSAISLSDAAELARQNKLSIPGDRSDTSNTTSFAPTPLDRLSPSEEKGELGFQLDKTAEGAKKEHGDSASSIQQPSLSNASSVAISNHSRLHIILPTSASHATSSGTVSNLRHCAVDLSPPTAAGLGFATLTLKNIKDSLIVCGRVNGSVHITGVENSIIVASCRQYRMHGSKNVTVYLHCSSRPIIEDCEQIRFASLPQPYVSHTDIFYYYSIK